MLNLVPYIFRNGETLDPFRLEANFQALRRNLADAVRLRYTHSVIRRKLSGLTETSTDSERQLFFSPPWPVELVAVELHAFGDDGVDLTLNALSGVTGWQPQAVTMLGADTRGRFEGLTAAPASARIATDAVAKFQLDVDAATFSVDEVEIVLHVRTDQHADGPPTFSPPGITAGDPISMTVFDDAIADWTVQYQVETDRDEQRRIQIVDLADGVTIGTGLIDSDQPLPQCGGTLRRVEVYRTTDGQKGITTLVQDETGSTIATLAVTGTQTEVDGDSAEINDAQDDAPLNAASDWRLRSTLNAAPGNLTSAYAVLYYE